MLLKEIQFGCYRASSLLLLNLISFFSDDYLSFFSFFLYSISYHSFLTIGQVSSLSLFSLVSFFPDYYSSFFSFSLFNFLSVFSNNCSNFLIFLFAHFNVVPFLQSFELFFLFIFDNHTRFLYGEMLGY